MRDYESPNVEAAAYLAREADPGDWPEDAADIIIPERHDAPRGSAPVADFEPQGCGNTDPNHPF